MFWVVHPRKWRVWKKLGQEGPGLRSIVCILGFVVMVEDFEQNAAMAMTALLCVSGAAGVLMKDCRSPFFVGSFCEWITVKCTAGVDEVCVCASHNWTMAALFWWCYLFFCSGADISYLKLGRYLQFLRHYFIFLRGFFMHSTIFWKSSMGVTAGGLDMHASKCNFRASSAFWSAHIGHPLTWSLRHCCWHRGSNSMDWCSPCLLRNISLSCNFQIPFFFFLGRGERRGERARFEESLLGEITSKPVLMRMPNLVSRTSDNQIVGSMWAYFTSIPKFGNHGPVNIWVKAGWC